MQKGTFNSEWVDQTILHPLGLAALLAAAVAMLLLPRRHAIFPMLALACFVAVAQRLYIAGMNFHLLRLMVLVGWARILLRSETAGFKWRSVDTFIVLWTISGTLVYTLLRYTADALIFRLGMSFDAIGMYFLFRCLVRDWSDVEHLARGVALLSVPVAIAFLIERATGRNAFAIFGGLPEVTVIRQGRLRCQGAFAHPILAGVFWASLMPLMAALWWKRGKDQVLAGVGVVCAVVIVLNCASSTPVAAVILALLGAAAFLVRRHLFMLRWMVPVALVILHLVMFMPVWHLVARLDFVAGSTGRHRFNLLDGAIRHFDEWWLLGTESTAHWGRLMHDVTNQYLVEGLRGGIWTMLLFLAIIVLCFRDAGRLWRAVEPDRPRLMMAWALGVALFVHVVSFLSVSYFGQIIMLWYLTLAMIVSLAPGQRVAPPSPGRAVRAYGRGAGGEGTHEGARARVSANTNLNHAISADPRPRTANSPHPSPLPFRSLPLAGRGGLRLPSPWHFPPSPPAGGAS